MTELTGTRRTVTAAISLTLLVTGLLAVLLAGGGRYGTSRSVLETVGLGGVETLVAAYGIVALLAGLAVGWFFSRRTPDDRPEEQ